MRSLTNAEVTAHKTTLETHEISSWEVRVTALFKSKTELAQYVLQCSNTEWNENLSFSKDYLGINRWMGSALVTMMARGTPRVDALLSRLARTNPEALCDARLILNEIKEETKIQHGQQEQIAIRRFLQFRPLRPGMTIEEVKCAASILQDHHQVLPERGRLRKHDFHYVLIEKMPASTTEMKRKKEELMTLLLEEVSSGSEPPWTVEKLMVKIGVYLSTVRYSGETLECEEAEGSHYDDEANALERRNAAKSGPRSPAGPAASGNNQGSRTPRGCSNCKSTAHKTQDCPKRCPNLACQERSCPGVRDKNLCPVVKDIFPPRSTLLDVYDNPLHSSCLERLKLKHARRKEKEARGEPTECEFADGEDCSIAMLSFDDEGFDSEEESYVAIGESSGDSDAPDDDPTFLLDDIGSPAEESESESDAIPKMDKDSSGSSDGDSSGGLEGARPGGRKKEKGENSKPKPRRNEGWLETTSASDCGDTRKGDMNAGGPVVFFNSPNTAIVAVDAVSQSAAVVALDADPPNTVIVAIDAVSQKAAVVSHDADPPSIAIDAADSSITAIVAIDDKGRDPGHNLAEILQKMVRRRAWIREWQSRIAEPEPQWLQDAAAILAGASKPAEVLAVEAEEEAEINDAEESDTEALEAMLDGGSNVNLFTSKQALQHATITTGETRKVTGVFGQKGEGLKPFKLRIELSEAKGDGTMQIDGLFSSEKGRRSILSEGWLYDRYAAPPASDMNAEPAATVFAQAPASVTADDSLPDIDAIGPASPELLLADDSLPDTALHPVFGNASVVEIKSLGDLPTNPTESTWFVVPGGASHAARARSRARACSLLHGAFAFCGLHFASFIARSFVAFFLLLLVSPIAHVVCADFDGQVFINDANASCSGASCGVMAAHGRLGPSYSAAVCGSSLQLRSGGPARPECVCSPRFAVLLSLPRDCRRCRAL